jgi:signal transduction histidine kinase
VLYGRASVADAEVERADQAAREQYAVLCRSIERREHERLLHDTVLNTLTALARRSGNAEAEVVTRCRQDVALIEATLGGADDLAEDFAAAPASADLLTEVGAVVTDMRARGLTVHFEGDDTAGTAVPVRVVMALASVVREALSNVAAHAGTGEAWVTVRRTAQADSTVQADSAVQADSTVQADIPGAPCRLQVVVRDRGSGFDPARVEAERLGLRRSITERTAECGGQASVRSAPGKGTEVSLCWPAPDYAVPAMAGQGLVPEGSPW